MSYTVLNPRGIRETIKRTPISPRLASLDGKTIYVVSQDRPFYTEEVARQLAAALPGSTVVYRRKPGWIRETDDDLWQEIYNEADALVYGTCMGAGSGMTAVSWLSEVERRGIPCVYLAGQLYEQEIRLSAAMRGIPALRTVMVNLVGEENAGFWYIAEQFVVERLASDLELAPVALLGTCVVEVGAEQRRQELVAGRDVGPVTGEHEVDLETEHRPRRGGHPAMVRLGSTHRDERPGALGGRCTISAGGVAGARHIVGVHGLARCRVSLGQWLRGGLTDTILWGLVEDIRALCHRWGVSGAR